MNLRFMLFVKKMGFLCLLMSLFAVKKVDAQQNVALTAIAQHTGSGTGTCPALPAVPTGYGPCLYNNDIVPNYNTTAAGNWGFVNTGGTIKFYWTPGNLPTANTISKMVFYKDFRPMVTADIQYWDALAGNWITCAVYNNGNNNVADSIFFPPIPIQTDTLRITKININATASAILNPNFREIQIWSLPDCNGAPFTGIQAMYNNAMVNTPLTNVCVGNIVYLSATSNQTSSGHGYQWQIAPSAGGPWTSILGATNAGYNAEAFGSKFYRVVDTCISSGLTFTSTTFEVTAATMTNATLSPDYFQSFEAWNTMCATGQYARDVPGTSWSNTPPSGLNTWRIDTSVAFTSGWNNASGTYSPTFIVGARSARVHTSGMVPGSTANLNLHLDLSTVAGGKQLYFYMINASSGIPGGDSLRVLMSTDNGDSWTRLASFDTAATWRRRSIPLNTNSANVILRFQGFKNSLITQNDGTDIGIDSLYIVGPCSGMPNPGNIALVSPTSACPGSTFNLTPIGTTMAGGLVFTWEKLVNGCLIQDFNVGGTGNNTASFTTPPIYDTLCYRMKVKCGTDSAYTNAITFNVPEPSYASLPHYENFESWITRCATGTTPVACTNCTLEAPSIYWANTPSTGNNSWRRNDQGTNAAWTTITGGAITTNAPQGSFYARFHSNQVVAGVLGNLDLLVNCSTSIGTKELQFQYNNINGTDSVRIFYSTNVGGNFIKAAAFGPNSNGWTNAIVPIPSNSANTVIRIQGFGDFGTSDIGIDQVVVLPPCVGMPNPGVISNAVPCPGANFTMNLLNSSQSASLTYQWYTGLDSNIANMTPIAGATNMNYTTNILVNTYYRVRVKCGNSLDTIFTPAKLINIASFYYCYCTSFASNSLGADIGNFTVRHQPSNAIITNIGTGIPLTNNATAVAIYTDNRFPNTPLIPMYHDSTYKLIVAQINSGSFTAATVSIWFDKNRNGVFDPSERIFMKNTTAISSPQQTVDTNLFINPDSFPVGITGLRVILENPLNLNPLQCGQYTTGETEDYLVDVRYPPCDGPTNAGTVQLSDTLSCSGYLITAVDTTHERKRHNISWLWQYSPDGNSWATVPNSQMRDTINQVINGPTFFRLRMLCIKQFSVDTTYSNVGKVSINPPYACYCYSLANGATLDSSDIGSFAIGNYNYTVTPPGPHLLNNQAIQSRTDNTKDTIVLWTNTTYPFMFYHIMNGSIHANAKVTIFMDFNNDLQYNVTSSYNERIYTGYTANNLYLVTGQITIPPYAIPNIKTGMRVILNNNTGANVQSDSACGPYISGETEEYVVIFRDSNLSAGTIGNVTQMYVYPNPTEGVFLVNFNAQKPVAAATIIVSNLMGQIVREEHFEQPGKEFNHSFDLTNMPKGVYVVELRADKERIVRKVIIK